jgi:hypothetical protein
MGFKGPDDLATSKRSISPPDRAFRHRAGRQEKGEDVVTYEYVVRPPASGKVFQTLSPEPPVDLYGAEIDNGDGVPGEVWVCVVLRFLLKLGSERHGRVPPEVEGAGLVPLAGHGKAAALHVEVLHPEGSELLRLGPGSQSRPEAGRSARRRAVTGSGVAEGCAVRFREGSVVVRNERLLKASSEGVRRGGSTRDLVV